MPLSVCIHGHFYQPPRENPWTGAIDPQPSAAPFHDWNQRITDECYEPNTRALILDAKGEEVARVNTYRHISFDFGPTLLRWLRHHDPKLHDAIVQADKDAVAATGHGNAMAQSYHHAILPLAPLRDKRTEVRWGIRDFEHRFGRKPEGMWLPECAVDTATLEVLAEQGIRFTVLAPTQAAAIRVIGEERWYEVGPTYLPTRRPYLVRLPSGAEIAVFFYDGMLSNGIAFGGLLHDGQAMAQAVLGAGSDGLVSAATDGESYGHHHRHGEMALAWALRELDQRDDIALTTYARYLAEHPPEHEAQLHEPSAWSCAHGVGRWTRNCGCAIDPARSGQQQWRGPLRRALEDLRHELDETYVVRMRAHGEDPWACRDTLIDELLDLEDRGVEEDGPFPFPAGDDGEIARLREIQHCVLRMFTSCAWFFDDPGGLETTQILRYAHRALVLHQELTGKDLEPDFVRALAALRSADPTAPTGREIWYQKVVAADRL